MSDCAATQCDRCGKRALRNEDDSMPSGWSTVRLIVPRPFCDTGHVDLCEVCTPIVYNTLIDKPGMLVNGRDPREPEKA